MVGTTGEPLRSKINRLQKCEGEIGPLKRNGYFERSPHQKGRRPGHERRPSSALEIGAGMPLHDSETAAGAFWLSRAT